MVAATGSLLRFNRTATPRTGTNKGVFAADVDYHPAWSPDGTRIAFRGAAGVIERTPTDRPGSLDQ